MPEANHPITNLGNIYAELRESLEATYGPQLGPARRIIPGMLSYDDLRPGLLVIHHNATQPAATTLARILKGPMLFEAGATNEMYTIVVEVLNGSEPGLNIKPWFLINLGIFPDSRMPDARLWNQWNWLTLAPRPTRSIRSRIQEVVESLITLPFTCRQRSSPAR